MAKNNSNPNNPDEENIIDELDQLEVFLKDLVKEERKNQKELDELSEFQQKVTYLSHNFGLRKKEAESVLNLKFEHIFSILARAGVEIDIILDVILNYIPLLEAENISTRSLKDYKLIEVLFAYTYGRIKKEKLYDCLKYAAKYPRLSIEQIILFYLPEARKEPSSEPAFDEIDFYTPILRQKPQKELKKHINAQQSVESKKAKQKAPSKERLKITKHITPDFTFDLEKADKMYKLTLYHQEKPIGSNYIPKNIRETEIRFLLIFKTNLPNLGNRKEFIEQAVPLIKKSLKTLAKQ